MSKRTFETHTGPDEEARREASPVGEGTPVRVRAGWDVEGDGLYLVIARTGGPGGPDVGVLYSNVGDSVYGPQAGSPIFHQETPSSLKRRLRDFAIEWPTEWYNDVLTDYEVGQDAKMGARDGVEGTCAGPEVEESYGVYERNSFEERLEKELERTPGLAGAIDTLYETGATGMDPPIMGALFRLGLAGTRDESIGKAHDYLLREGYIQEGHIER
jgi:hypothetical protein